MLTLKITMKMNQYQRINFLLINATCFQNLLDFSFGKTRKLSLLAANVGLNPIIINSTAFLKTNISQHEINKKIRNTILNNYWYKETIKILIDSMIFRVYKASSLISSSILTRFQGKSGNQRVKYFK